MSATIEKGRRSPTVRQLDRLLAACGLQARVTLEPRAADLDAALDEALDTARSGAAALPVETLLRFAAALDAVEVSWAVDGITAVALQGLALEQSDPSIALVDDWPSRQWLKHIFAQGTDAAGFRLAPTWEEPGERIRIYVRHLVYTRIGFVRLRFLEAPPRTVGVAVQDRVLPVLPLLRVEQDHPQLADILARHRERQGGG